MLKAQHKSTQTLTKTRNLQPARKDSHTVMKSLQMLPSDGNRQTKQINEVKIVLLSSLRRHYPDQVLRV